MIETVTIVPVEEYGQRNPMVVQPKTIREIQICIDLQSLNTTYVQDPLPTPFRDEVLENVGGRESYSFMDVFSRYHQVQITEEDQAKSAFATEWGSFQYTVIPFGLKNSPVVFSQIVVATFKDFIHKFLEVYFDDGTVFSLVKDHIQALWLMLNYCCQLQISLNLKKCIFCTLFGILIGHVICKDSLLVDPTKISAILDIVAPTSVQGMIATLVHT